MKRLLPYLLLAACGSETPDQSAEEAPALPPATLPATGNEAAMDPAILQARVDSAMKAVLQDSDGAAYRNVRPGLMDTVCGEVDPAGKGGRRTGFRPFIVTQQGAALVARGPVLSFDDPTDSFPDLYIRWCASEEELKRLGPQLDRAIARQAGPDGVLGNIEDIPPPPLPPDAAGPPPEAQPPKPVPSEKMGKGDSFFDSVRKPVEPAGKDK
ncbi:MAG TPA: hypothetical protein VK472_04870 [Allosphingosinicella sp.]|nr:hypothetical protein [Allosphingosinicella sp.]